MRITVISDRSEIEKFEDNKSLYIAESEYSAELNKPLSNLKPSFRCNSMIKQRNSPNIMLFETKRKQLNLRTSSRKDKAYSVNRPSYSPEKSHGSNSRLIAPCIKVHSPSKNSAHNSPGLQSPLGVSFDSNLMYKTSKKQPKKLRFPRKGEMSMK